MGARRGQDTQRAPDSHFGRMQYYHKSTVHDGLSLILVGGGDYRYGGELINVLLTLDSNSLILRKLEYQSIEFPIFRISLSNIW